MRRRAVFVLSSILLAGLAAGVPAQQTALPHPRVKALRITILSTMLADAGIGEWGFAALVEVDGRRILFDTGARPQTVLQNARELKLDLSNITDVILSHNHADHTGGFVTLRRELRATSPQAMWRAHVADGIFYSRPQPGAEGNSMIATRREYEGLGGTFIVHSKPVELFPGVWLTGPVPRVHQERNWSGTGKMQTPSGVEEDNLPEDMSLVFDTDEGLVLLSGCGHAGIINTLDYARKSVRAAPVHAAIGGFHLFQASDETLAWTAGKLQEMELSHLVGAHCTGIEAVYRIRQLTHLDRKRCVVGAVGSTFTLGRGIDPLSLAR